MGTWIEFRCEDRTDPQRKNCWSDQNSGPMDMALDTIADVVTLIRELNADAKRAGWKRLKEGWVCSNCAARRAALTTTKAGGAS